jgi:ubiquinone/menaquinone biosynthesis C-methylase UbiE
MRRHIHVRFMTFLAVALFVISSAVQAQGGSVATERIFEALGLGSGLTVCEIGAGNGELSLAAARLVGPEGRVYTSELGDERVKGLQDRVAPGGLPQVTVVAGDPVKTNFPEAACDALFMRNVYHHFADPAAMNASMAASLKPGGRLAIIDFTPPGEEASRPADRSRDGMHGISAESVSRELTAAGFEPVATEAGTGRWFMVVVRRPAALLDPGQRQ